MNIVETTNAATRMQKNFVKDGDDYIPRRPVRRPLVPGAPRIIHKKCECGGKLKLKGSLGTSGHTSAKCSKCGKRSYTRTYRGRTGLVRCY